MQILVIGTSHLARTLSNHLAENRSDLIFSTAKNTCANFIDINPKDVLELRDFALANEVNLTVVCDIDLMELNFNESFNEENLLVFSPEPDSIKIVTHKSTGKKFIYKHKIPTPKFAIFEKPNLAIEHCKGLRFPIVIKPDKHEDNTFIAETFSKAKERIETLFHTNTKRVLVEEFIEGKEVTIYVISDGFNPIFIDSTKSYLDRISIKGADFISEPTMNRIFDTVIFPTISALSSDGNEFIGILGFDFIIDSRDKFYLIEYNAFFRELDSELMIQGTDINWAKLFESAIVGTLTENYPQIQSSEENFGSFRLDGEIITATGLTPNALKNNLELLGVKNLCEASRVWKN